MKYEFSYRIRMLVSMHSADGKFHPCFFVYFLYTYYHHHFNDGAMLLNMQRCQVVACHG